MSTQTSNTDEVYRELAQHLDRLPAGFPATDIGVEIRILKRLFNVVEARIACALSMQLESARQIASRLTVSETELEPILQEMASKGLIFRKDAPHGTRFMAAQFVVGIWEYHVNDLDAALIRDFNLYVPYLAQQWRKQKTQQLRVIPITRKLAADFQVMPYDQAEAIIRRQSKIAVAPCICRKEHALTGRGCDKPLEVCLIFGSGAYYYETNGLGRGISQEEALELLKQGVEAGLVLQPGNAQKAVNLCMCCGCCCQVLKNIKSFPNPATLLNSSYFAIVDQALCIACGACRERCPMEAVNIGDTALIDLDRCIGCGVCTLACDVEAVSLMGKPAAKRWIPPRNVFETYVSIARERGLF